MEDLFTKSYDGRLRFRGSEFYRLVNQVVSRHKENSDSDLRFQMPNDVQRISEVSSSPSSSTPRVDVSASMTVARSDGSESLDMLSSNIVTPSPSPAPIQSDTGMDRLLSEIFAESGL